MLNFKYLKTMGSILGQIEFYFDFLLIFKRYFKKVIFSYVLLG